MSALTNDPAWREAVNRYHEINLRLIPQLQKELRQRIDETMSGYFSVAELRRALLGFYSEEVMLMLAKAAGLDEETARWNELRGEARTLRDVVWPREEEESGE